MSEMYEVQIAGVRTEAYPKMVAAWIVSKSVSDARNGMEMEKQLTQQVEQQQMKQQQAEQQQAEQQQQVKQQQVEEEKQKQTRTQRRLEKKRKREASVSKFIRMVRPPPPTPNSPVSPKQLQKRQKKQKTKKKEEAQTTTTTTTTTTIVVPPSPSPLSPPLGLSSNPQHLHQSPPTVYESSLVERIRATTPVLTNPKGVKWAKAVQEAVPHFVGILPTEESHNSMSFMLRVHSEAIILISSTCEHIRMVEENKTKKKEWERERERIRR